jgi:hypothetical protein
MKKKKISKGFAVSILLCLCYIIGFLCLFLFFEPLTKETLTTAEHFNYILENKTNLQIWYLCIYILFGLFLIPLTLIVKDFLRDQKLGDLTAVFGFIWAAFVLASGFIFIVGVEKITHIKMNYDNKIIIWKTIEILQDALGGGIELIGGIWVFLIGVSGCLKKKFNPFFNVFSILLGVLGMVTVLPFLLHLGSVFGLFQIIWFLLLGFFLRVESCRKQNT